MDIGGLRASVKKLGFSKGFASTGSLNLKKTFAVPLRIYDPFFHIIEAAAPEFAQTVQTILTARDDGLPAIAEDAFKCEFSSKRLGAPMKHLVKIWELPENERRAEAKPLIESNMATFDSKVVAIAKPTKKDEADDVETSVTVEFSLLIPCSMLRGVDGPELDRLDGLTVYLDMASQQPELIPDKAAPTKRDKKQPDLDLPEEKASMDDVAEQVGGRSGDFIRRKADFVAQLKEADLGLSGLCLGLTQAGIDPKSINGADGNPTPAQAREALAEVFAEHEDGTMTAETAAVAIAAIRQEVSGDAGESAWGAATAASKANHGDRESARGWTTPEALVGSEEQLSPAGLQVMLEQKTVKELRGIYGLVFKSQTRKAKALLVEELHATLLASLKSATPDGWPRSLPWNGWTQRALDKHVDGLDDDDVRELYREVVGAEAPESNPQDTVSAGLKAVMAKRFGSRLLGG